MSIQQSLLNELLSLKEPKTITKVLKSQNPQRVEKFNASLHMLEGIKGLAKLGVPGEIVNRLTQLAPNDDELNRLRQFVTEGVKVTRTVQPSAAVVQAVEELMSAVNGLEELNKEYTAMAEQANYGEI